MSGLKHTARLFSKAATKEYKANWDKVFGKEFPMPAERDPWRESEPDATTADTMCDSKQPDGDNVCTRVIGHDGHHVARDTEDVVYARWLDEGE